MRVLVNALLISNRSGRRVLMEHLFRLAARVKPDFMFTPSGTVVPGLSLPQVSFAQNPWCLVRGLKRSICESKFTAPKLPQAVNEAAMMIFNSEYMREAYRENAGCHARCTEVVYYALDEEAHRAAEAARQNTAGTFVLANRKKCSRLLKARHAN